MRPEAEAYLKSQLAAFGGDFEREHVLSPDPVPTGVRTLDDALGGGLACGTYTIVGGAAGVGKSALACQILYNMARAGACPLYITCEMPAQQVRTRIASIHSTVAHGLMPFAWSRARDAFRGCMDAKQTARWRAADEGTRAEWADRYLKKYGHADPAVCSWRSMAHEGIAQRAMVREDVQSLDAVAQLIAERAGYGIRDAVIVDYAQILDVPGADSEYERMTRVSRTLQQAARAAQCPVLLVSSLKNIGKDEKEPGLSWFRGSGYLGYDAGAAIVLKGAGWATPEVMDVELHVLKNRTGRVPDRPEHLMSNPKYGTFD